MGEQIERQTDKKTEWREGGRHKDRTEERNTNIKPQTPTQPNPLKPNPTNQPTQLTNHNNNWRRGRRDKRRKTKTKR